MPNHISSDEFQRFTTAVFERMDRTDDKIDGLTQKQNENNVKQAVINSDVSNIKKKYSIVTGAIITLMVGTVWSKVTEQPVINQHKEIKIETKLEPKGRDKNE